MSCLPPELDQLLQRDGAVIFVCGPKEKGKTNIALLLGELAIRMGYRKGMATNIWTESYYVKQITNFPDLKEWLQTSGKKAYILDEAGKHIKKMRFMSEQNTEIMDLIQLIRHYDALFIGCAPSETFIDSQFLNTDILDAKIRKLTQKRAKVYDYLNNLTYFLNNIPTTSIKYNSKDIATFSMQKKISLSDLEPCCRVARFLEENPRTSYGDIGRTFTPPLQVNQVKDLIVKHIKHLQITANQEVEKPNKVASPL